MIERAVAREKITGGLKINAHACPMCNGKTGVYRTSGTRRNRKCLACGHRYVTRELLQSQIDIICGMVDNVLDLVGGEGHGDGDDGSESGD